MRLFLTTLLFIFQLVSSRPLPSKERLLVVFDDSNAEIQQNDVSEPLRQRGYEVDVVGIKDHPTLVKYGEIKYDHAIIVPGKTKALGSTLKQSDLLEFLELGGNMIALTTPKYNPKALRDLSANLGIDVTPRGVEFIDNFNSKLEFPHPEIVRPNQGEEIRSGDFVSHSSTATLQENEYLLGLVQCPATSFSIKENDVFANGGESFLAASIQSTQGSRFVWVGSTRLLHGVLFDEISKYAFGEKGTLRLNKVSHHGELLGTQSHQHYMVEENLTFCAVVEEFDGTKFVPYTKIEDVQVEFKMLDPYYRLNLKKNGCVSFKAPQQYGMFTFNLDYKRPGFTFLKSNEVVTIRHRANDEWTRSFFITNSWVYLSGVSTTVMAFVLFVLMYLTLPSEVLNKKTKKN